ncbi:hypothetical protein D3C77_638100 [compost metagenome]
MQARGGQAAAVQFVHGEVVGVGVARGLEPDRRVVALVVVDTGHVVVGALDHQRHRQPAEFALVHGMVGQGIGAQAQQQAGEQGTKRHQKGSTLWRCHTSCLGSTKW